MHALLENQLETWLLVLFAKPPEEKCNQKTDEDRRRDRQIKAKITALDDDIPRQASQAEFLYPRPRESDYDKQNANAYEDARYAWHVH